MDRGELIYLDNAATSFPKPRAVSDAVRFFMENVGGNPGRGAHMLSLEAAREVFECRCALAELFDADTPEQVSFTLNTTEALNLAIKGLLHRGDHVLISDLEHNAVYRPVYALAAREGVEFDIYPSMAGCERRSSMKIVAEIAKRLKKNTKMVVCTASSNICSVSMPLCEIGEFCRKNGLLFVVDGAQGAGHMRLSMKKMHISALCLPGHKGLLGPQGCGAVIFKERLIADTLLEGGNGIASLDAQMPKTAPERYESGTLPTPAIVGLKRGIDTVRELGVERIAEHEAALFCEARELLANIGGVKIYYPDAIGSVMLFNIEGQSSERVARTLSEAGICTRGGYHCTALGHKTLGTLEHGGVRISFGPFNSSNDISKLASAVARIAKEEK